MSARDELRWWLDQPFSPEDEEAEQLFNALVSEVRRADALRLLNERAQHKTRAIFCQGLTHAANRLTQWADEEVTP